MSPTAETAASGMTMRLAALFFITMSMTQQQSCCSSLLALTVMPVSSVPVTFLSPYTDLSTAGFSASSRV